MTLKAQRRDLVFCTHYLEDGRRYRLGYNGAHIGGSTAMMLDGIEPRWHSAMHVSGGGGAL